MEALRVQARLRGGIATSRFGVALDALLGKMICKRDGVPPAFSPDEVVDLDIPIAKSECGRFYLTSFGLYEAEQYGCAFIHKPPVVREAMRIGNPKTIATINVTAGVNKGYRLPVETAHLVDDAITWYCVGDAERIADLLTLVPALGRKRGIGFGRIAHRDPFTITRLSETWDGFPVVHDGQPLRTLPAEYPWLGMAAGETGYACLAPPYWMHERETLCVLPEMWR